MDKSHLGKWNAQTWNGLDNSETVSHEEPEPAKFVRGTSENFERKVKFLE